VKSKTGKEHRRRRLDRTWQRGMGAGRVRERVRHIPRMPADNKGRSALTRRALDGICGGRQGAGENEFATCRADRRLRRTDDVWAGSAEVSVHSRTAPAWAIVP
jgi:hypothetical protein